MTTKSLKDVIERLQTWPAERQDDAARVLIEMERQDASPYRLSAAQAREVERIRQGLHEGTEAIASDEEMAALWKSCGL